jgi:hypothetical protein
MMTTKVQNSHNTATVSEPNAWINSTFSTPTHGACLAFVGALVPALIARDNGCQNNRPTARTLPLVAFFVWSRPPKADRFGWIQTY